MWAQLISLRVKDDSDAAVTALVEHLQSIEQADSGWVRTTAMRDQSDPNRVLILAVFEDEAKARARESDPRRADGLATLRTMMGEILAGAPEFTDLVVLADVAP